MGLCSSFCSERLGTLFFKALSGWVFEPPLNFEQAFGSKRHGLATC
jgi:hypothetical protein